ncbi:hypothetical protein N7450_011721 [Penicillium hetheringtonii]|uniref:AA9 family lytic polysaccharide monooxygenase n=1 Tax=Penicillium hetheringtonii TaxID=911720 RepID=A0AAD6DBE5_9EURO|nr:hypothetical protein N7450_011721 [Penicillium hetheringtonii]
MHLPFVFAITAALAQLTAGHYIFSKLVLNGEVSDDWQYIRETTRDKCYMPTKFSSTFDNLTPSDPDFRCNLGSFTNAAKTEVANVAAGDTIAMKLFYDGSIAHPGPGQVYISKAPSGSVQEYEGDGEWFKIWETTICDESGDLTTDAWCAYGLSEFEFQIPENTPAGEYLVRAEHVGLHAVLKSRSRVLEAWAPDITYSIPGLYDDSMTLFNGLSVWTDSVDTIKSDIANTPIGDEVWSGGSARDSSVSSSSASTSATPGAGAKFTCGRSD